MPSRFISLVILVYWSVAAFFLLTWDVIPELTSGYAPDLRAITLAGDSSKPVRWNIQVIDDPRFPDTRRMVGEAVTGSSRKPDGWTELTSHVEIDAAGLLKGAPFLSRSPSFKLMVASVYRVDPTGNLHSFNLDVKSHDSTETLIAVKGKFNKEKKKMEIESRGPVEILNRNHSIDYLPRSVVQDVLGPLDRLPGLHVGQKWETQMINPFTAQVDNVHVEVKRTDLIKWNGDVVTAFEVLQDVRPISMRTWVRLDDGVILQQEVPLPFVRLVMERRADGDEASSNRQTRLLSP
jgi:hypothetical protein